MKRKTGTGERGRMSLRVLVYTGFLIFGAFLVTTTGVAQDAVKPRSLTSGTPSQSKRYITIDFDNVDKKHFFSYHIHDLKNRDS